MRSDCRRAEKNPAVGGLTMRNANRAPFGAGGFPGRMSLAGIIFAFVSVLQGVPARVVAQAPPVAPSPDSQASSVLADAPGARTRQASFADQVWRDPKTGVEFVKIPGGEFDMGSDTFANEKPVHRVRVAEFWLARTEVTQAQWRAVMRSIPSKQQVCDQCPVTQTSWEDVQKYLRRTAYRLPSEAEWEFAAGGGAEHQRWAGTSHEAELGEFAWYRGNSGNRPHPVGQKRPNLFGLFDMSGNVYEWCADWYDTDYYQASPTDNPPGPKTGTRRVALAAAGFSIPGSMA